MRRPDLISHLDQKNSCVCCSFQMGLWFGIWHDLDSGWDYCTTRALLWFHWFTHLFSQLLIGSLQRDGLGLKNGPGLFYLNQPMIPIIKEGWQRIYFALKRPREQLYNYAPGSPDTRTLRSLWSIKCVHIYFWCWCWLWLSVFIIVVLKPRLTSFTYEM